MKPKHILFALLGVVILLAAFGCTPTLDQELRDLRPYSTLAQFGVAPFKDGFERTIANCWAADPDTIVTDCHVVRGTIHPWTVNGHVATLLYKDEGLDIAVLSCPSHGLPSYRIRESYIGEEVNLIGYLENNDGRDVPYVGAGKINALDFHDGYLYNGGCQPGISGSPVFGKDSQIIGEVLGYIDCRGSANTTHTRLARGGDIRTALSRARLGLKTPPPPPPPNLGPRATSRPATRPTGGPA